MGTLSGTTVMITGASRGLGRALARAAAREGASLAICARDGEALETAAEECRALGVEVLAVLADVSDAADVERFAATALERFGGVDVLVNNAAELGPLPLPQLTDAPSSALEHVLQANVLGPLRLTQAVIGGMLLRNRGLVVNISTDAALIGFAGLGLYSASKAALDALTRSWSAELQHTAVRVISVDPGDMYTEMHMAADPEADPDDLLRPEDVAERLLTAGGGATARSRPRRGGEPRMITAPRELRASLPAELRGMRRDGARLCVVERASGRISHTIVARLGEHLAPGDLLVVNSSRTLACGVAGLPRRAQSRSSFARAHSATASGTRWPWRQRRRIATSRSNRARSSALQVGSASAYSNLAATPRCSGVCRSKAVTRFGPCSAMASRSATRTCPIRSRSSTTRRCTRALPARSRHPRPAAISHGSCSASCAERGVDVTDIVLHCGLSSFQDDDVDLQKPLIEERFEIRPDDCRPHQPSGTGDRRRHQRHPHAGDCCRR